MEIAAWVRRNGGIVHRRRILDAGASERQLRAALAAGEVQRERRYWVTTGDAHPLLITAARATAKVACVSAARLRGWWLPPDVDERVHLAVKRHGATPQHDGVLHWDDPLVPLGPLVLTESVVDALEHIAGCVPFESATVLWESAARIERLAGEELTLTRWRTPAARRIAQELTVFSDSGLETLVVVRLTPWGLPLRQQVVIAGHPVDILVGARLVIQLDGFAYHSSPADRARDLAHDRALIARGYTVLRFTYAEVVHHWDRVERAIAAAIAQGRHLAA